MIVISELTVEEKRDLNSRDAMERRDWLGKWSG
jgi:hypothetical protein